MSYRQIDPGTYTVHINDGGTLTQVGWCYVAGSGNNTVEHYALVNNYQAPTSSQALHLEASSTSYSSTSQFFTAMHNEEPEQAPYEYIKAVCTRYETVPG